MTKQEFDRIVDDAVKNGATRAEAEAYVRDGFKLGDDAFSDKAVGGRRSAVSKKKAKKG